jgi:NAD(P)-dependent dehydrogenase (short-subunit alcohol dehydrogenase family)
LASRFAAEGMKVMMADIEKDALEAAVEKVGHGAAYAIVDVRSAEQVNALAQRTIHEFGEVHIVCNNAGVGMVCPATEVRLEDWEWIVGVNLLGVVNGIQAFLPLLVAQGEGHIVNTASIVGLAGVPMTLPYGASKAAVVSITETLAAEFAAQGSKIGASVLCPGVVRTRIMDAERNRPGGRSHKGLADQLAAVGQQAMDENGLDPDDVAGQVVDGIRSGRVHILTSAEDLQGVRRRMELLLSSV